MMHDATEKTARGRGRMVCCAAVFCLLPIAGAIAAPSTPGVGVTPAPGAAAGTSGATSGGDARWVRIGQMLKNFDSSGAMNWSWIAVAGTGVALILLGLWLWQRSRSRHLRTAPILTFRRVAAALGLGLSDQLMLIRIARHEVLPSPLTLVLSPATLAHHATHYTEHLSAPQRPDVLSRVANLSKALFGETDAGNAQPDATPRV
jgi:hypothetical protein